MGAVKIFSKNAAYQSLEALKANRNKRYKRNAFFVEGVRNINEAVRSGWRIISFAYAGGKKLSAWADGLLETVRTDENYELTEALMRDLSGKEEGSELLAVAQMKKDGGAALPLSENPVAALFDRPSNKGNLGAVLRSCDALGVDGLVITGHAVDVYDPDVIGSSMGSFFCVPFYRLYGNGEIDAYIRSLRTRYPQIKIIGTTAHSQTRLQDIDLRTPVLFLIGNETDGLNRHLADVCDVMATIPMRTDSSASSLNVGCAATVMFYEAFRQRG